MIGPTRSKDKVGQSRGSAAPRKMPKLTDLYAIQQSGRFKFVNLSNTCPCSPANILLISLTCRGIISYHISKAYSYQVVRHPLDNKPITIPYPDSKQKVPLMPLSHHRSGPTTAPTEVRVFSEISLHDAQSTPVKHEELGLLVKFSRRVTIIEERNSW